MEYFKIETVEELKQAYEQLKWDSAFSLGNELYHFNKDSSFRFIVKDKEGNHSLVSDSGWDVDDKNKIKINPFLCPLSETEIPNPLKSNKYSVECKGVQIDVYDVLKAFNVQCPATQHAIKKLLKTGKRGHKDAQQDLTEAIESINRAKQLRNE